MPNVLPTIPNDPPQGIQALLDKVYLWNPDVSNELIEKINALLAKLGDAIGAIRPYSELVVPINQYEPCYYGSGVYVAARELDEIPMEFNEADWILIATKGVTAEEVAQTYLPLSGGTMTGAINFDIDASAYADIPIVNGGSVSGGIIALTCDNKGVPDGGVKVPGRIITSGTVVAAGGFGNKYTPVGAYLNKLNNGADLIVPTEGGTLARIEDINTIGGDGTAGQVLTKTEDGMAWQDAAGGSSLPDQTGNAGKFLTTDGTEAAWTGGMFQNALQDNVKIMLPLNGEFVPVINVSQYNSGVFYGKVNPAFAGVRTKNVVAVVDNNWADSYKFGEQSVTLAVYGSAKGERSVAIGFNSFANGTRSIQIGTGTNEDANTLKVGNANGNFEMMDANGNVPLERLTYVTNQIGDISTALTAILGE